MTGRPQHQRAANIAFQTTWPTPAGQLRGRGGRYSRGSLVVEEPGPSEGGQLPQVVGLMPLDELALHLLWRADHFGFPLKRHLAATRLTEDLGPPDIGFLVALEDDGGCPVAVGWGAAEGPLDHTRPCLMLYSNCPYPPHCPRPPHAALVPHATSQPPTLPPTPPHASLTPHAASQPPHAVPGPPCFPDPPCCPNTSPGPSCCLPAPPHTAPARPAPRCPRRSCYFIHTHLIPTRLRLSLLQYPCH